MREGRGVRSIGLITVIHPNKIEPHNKRLMKVQ